MGTFALVIGTPEVVALTLTSVFASLIIGKPANRGAARTPMLGCWVTLRVVLELYFSICTLDDGAADEGVVAASEQTRTWTKPKK